MTLNVCVCVCVCVCWLCRVYDRRDFHAELTSLLTLRRVCDRLIHSVDEHFRTKYLRQSVDVLTKFNPYFIVAWQVKSYCRARERVVINDGCAVGRV